jgi:hypothetical protein
MGGGPTTAREKAILSQVSAAFNQLAKKFKIGRKIRVLVCDDGTWKHLRLSTRVAMHYDPGAKDIPESIFIRAEIFNHPGNPEVGHGRWKHILAHEMVHMKLKGRQGKASHDKFFWETAEKYGVPRFYQRRGME